MKRFRVLFVAFLLLASGSLLWGGGTPSSHLVSPQWLKKNLKNSALVIVDLRKSADYSSGHIPGAINVPKHDYFQKGRMGDIPGLIDTPMMMKDLLSKFGLDRDREIVLYSYGNSYKRIADATRVLWTLMTYGFRNVYVLDGGFEEWKSLGFPVSSRMPKIVSRKVEPHEFTGEYLATWQDVYRSLVGKKIQFIDTRNIRYFTGRDNDRRLKKHGHIPGAILIPLKSLFYEKDGNYLFKDGNSIRKILAEKGIDPHAPIVVYCNTGHLASGVWFALRFIAGLKDVKLYDASMVEYSRMPLPVKQ